MGLRKKLKTLMSRYNVGSRFANIPLQKASILLPVVIKEGRLHTILTVRSMKLSVMPGQVCFPGGRQDPGDQDYVETALRESREEIGLCPNQVEVIGNFVPCISMPPAVYVVTPVVGIVEDTFQPTSNPKEVTDVLCIPLEFFLSRDHCTVVVCMSEQ
ncbi:peroxisomal coenzyme A diphosphatase NUDT7-like isoform X2 [Hyperolius riggenbachi]|uniref:peroxisomal coenzyme A diphosphatase NUDT7-like isoform X2 n=1 Tax=Hyperolius riggenbachi TaxID=752182 RepID=UPI0035A37B05